ncbi:MarR family transcriptional regulator [Altererythrobacter indicus]|uniref:MarR family transcriptional regulator n=1 Tax=Altericroceibacterium indicum TaxID=374177 RepID=A0A845A8R9_9SPHN|nr:MarR family winged helix-turn-helix transcriptional regulator [Altericroceibacterium indicum]MXP24956.1 MarR family transcriptional regulator [Altericroceibacterium indicum]
MTLPETWNLFGANQLPHRLLLLAKMIDRVSSRSLQEQFGMSVAQWRVLAFICTFGPTTGANLSQSAEIDGAEISRAVKALLDKGMVEREFAEGSRKRQIIMPTESGKALFSKVRVEREGYFGKITANLSQKQRDELSHSLEIIATAVDRERN